MDIKIQPRALKVSGISDYVDDDFLMVPSELDLLPLLATGHEEAGIQICTCNSKANDLGCSLQLNEETLPLTPVRGVSVSLESYF